MKIGRLELTVFVCGAALMVIEVLGSRIVAPYLGSSLYSWTSIISVVLGSLSLGYWYGGRIADRNPEEKRYFLIVLFAGASALIIPFLVPIAMLFGVPLGPRYGPLVASAILFAPSSFIFGMVSPFAVKLKTREVGEVGSVSGSLYAISTLGSITGTLLAGFVLIPNFGVKATLVGTGGLVTVMALYYVRNRLVSGFFLAALLISAFSPSYLFARSGDLQFSSDSEYFHIDVIDRNGTRVMVLDADSQSAMELGTVDYLYSYVRAFTLAGAFVKPERVLLLGGGGSTIGRHYLENSDALVDVVEIDPKVMEAAKAYFGFPEGERTEVYLQDAREFLNAKTGNGEYDVVFVDIYSSHWSIPYHVTTVEAVNRVKAKLKPKGVAVANVISSVEGDKSAVLRSIYSTYKEVFKEVYVLPMEPSSPEKLQNIVIFAVGPEARPDWAVFERINQEMFPEGGPELYRKEVAPGLVLTDDYAPMESLVASSFG